MNPVIRHTCKPMYAYNYLGQANMKKVGICTSRRNFFFKNQHKRKTERGSYGKEALGRALQDILDGHTVSHVSRVYKIPRKTLQRH